MGDACRHSSGLRLDWAVHRALPDRATGDGGRQHERQRRRSSISPRSRRPALNDPHPTWVSYYVVNSKDQNWQHETTWVSAGPHPDPRDDLPVRLGDRAAQPFLSQATGTVGGTFELNGKTTRQINPNLASHVFAIPALGLSVPLEGASATAKNPCGNAPCTLSQAHTTNTFTFRTGAKGLYRWQCFVPCAAGFVAGSRRTDANRWLHGRLPQGRLRP